MGDRGPRTGATDAERPFVIRIKQRGPVALFVEILLGYHDHHVATRLEERPPFCERLARTVHMLQHVRAMYAIERFGRQLTRDVIGIAMPLIEGPRMWDHQIATAANVQDCAGHHAADKIGSANAVRFLRLKHQRAFGTIAASVPIARVTIAEARLIARPPRPLQRTPSYWIAPKHSSHLHTR